MMFSSSSLDKNCINSDSNSLGRNSGNAPNRFSVGISPLGEENQQIRIQLAVRKYNGTASDPINNKCSLMSPVRHSFLKNSLKVRDYEGDTEGTSKTEKRIGNQYEGVGAFPTVHLKKTAVRYRPIKRFHDVKIPYPELPVNRFLSHAPEVCDLKSSPRSVLDVLEDLSGNKIHLKDESENSKSTLRGLGGDYHLNPNAVYKPLFVQKPKLNPVLTRDNTTQTLSSVSTESSSSQRSNSYVKNGTSDPRVELRRKLAKQNNEIFASLSSSISSAFSLKRKIDKVLQDKEDSLLSNGSTKKKTKTFTDHSAECSENGISKPVITCKTNSSESVKLNRKSKPSETNSVSPNKDRLTTIFLDMRNTSPKAQVFQANTPRDKKVEKGAEKARNGLLETENNTGNSVENDSSAQTNKNENRQNVIGFNFSGKSASCNTDKKEEEQPYKSVVNFTMSKIDTLPKDSVKFTSPALQLSVSAAETPNVDSPKIPSENTLDSNETAKGNDSEKKDSNSNNKNHSYTVGSSTDKPNFGSFKFGANGNTTLVHNKPFTDLKSSISEPISVGDSTATSSTPQFSFGTTSSDTLPALQTSAVQFSATMGQNTFNAPGKMIFTFGQNALVSQPNSKNMSTETKPEMSTAFTTATSTTSEKTQSVAFTFGQKQITNPVPNGAKQDIASPINQANQPIVAPAFDAGLNKNSPGATASSGVMFSFGQKSATSVASAVPAAAAEEQTKTFSFSFGQKSDASANKIQLGENSGNLLSSEQVGKSVSQASVQSNAVSTATTQTSQTFVQTVPPATFTPQSTFSQTPNTFVTKFAGNLMSTSSTTKFSQIDGSFGPDKPLSFESSKNDFGKTTTQTTTSFLTPTSNTPAPALNFRVSTTTQNIPTFDTFPTTQTAPIFGASSTTQSISGFGCTTTSQSAPTFESSATHSASSGFSIPCTTQSTLTLEIPTAPQSTTSFGSSSAKQSTPSFGTTSTQVTPSFGVSSPTAPAFGTCSTTKTTPAFASNTSFGPSSQSGVMFNAPTSAQSVLHFGASQTTQSNTTFGASSGFTTTPSSLPSTAFGTPAATSASSFPASQSFDNKPIPSLVQTPSIFTQNLGPAFSSAPTFSSTQNDIFAQKPTTETPLFGQNKIQTSGFGSTSQPFGAQNKFSFGMSTTNVTAFTTSPPLTTTAPVFSFGGSTSGNAFAFGSSAAGPNSQTPFAFKTSANEPFKFGAATTTVNTTTATSTTTTVQSAPPATFSFGSQINNNLVTEQKSPFSFGSSQPLTSAPAFNFGSAMAPSPTPSVFNFGGSTSSASSSSSFNFGTPTPGVPFGQTPSFAVPGTFNIGSGSSQSRPRASSRPRRRP